jgi:hypothetical protein
MSYGSPPGDDEQYISTFQLATLVTGQVTTGREGETLNEIIGRGINKRINSRGRSVKRLSRESRGDLGRRDISLERSQMLPARLYASWTE